MWKSLYRTLLLFAMGTLVSCGEKKESAQNRVNPILPWRNSEEPNKSWRSLPVCQLEPDRILACAESWTLGQPCPSQEESSLDLELSEKKRTLLVALQKLELQASRALCLISEIWIGPLPEGAWGRVDRVDISPEGWGRYQLYLHPRIFGSKSMSSWLRILDEDRWRSEVALAYEYNIVGGDPLLHLLHHELGHILDDHLQLSQGQYCGQGDCEIGKDRFVGRHWRTFSQPRDADAQDLRSTFCMDRYVPCKPPIASEEPPLVLFQRLAQTNFPSPYSLFSAREFAAEAYAWHALQQQSGHSSYEVSEQGEVIKLTFDLGISAWID